MMVDTASTTEIQCPSLQLWAYSGPSPHQFWGYSAPPHLGGCSTPPPLGGIQIPPSHKHTQKKSLSPHRFEKMPHFFGTVDGSAECIYIFLLRLGLRGTPLNSYKLSFRLRGGSRSRGSGSRFPLRGKRDPPPRERRSPRSRKP